MPAQTAELFPELPVAEGRTCLAAGAWLLHGFALDEADALLAHIKAVEQAAPFRHLITPGGKRMSVAMSNCGRVGWHSDRAGYRYVEHDPVSGHAWPGMPAAFLSLAQRAAAEAGYDNFQPDVCLINRYQPGARLSLHQDRDEGGFEAPIVSVSLGVSARFLFGGQQRHDPCRRLPLGHGDVVVWGGPSRMAYHGIAPLAASRHPATGALRYNLTFRTARKPGRQAG